MTQITELLKSFPEIEDGVHESRLKEVLFFQETKHVPRRPIIYDPGIAIVAQGHKIGYLGGRSFNMMPIIIWLPLLPCLLNAKPAQPLRNLCVVYMYISTWLNCMT